MQAQVLTEGDGVEVGTGAAVVANYAGYVWGSDTPFDSSFDRGAPTMFSLNSVVKGWTTGIPGAAVGSRLLLSIPPELGYGSEGNAQAGIGGTDTIVFVIDIVDAYNADAVGQADATVVDGDLPVTIEGDLGSPATLTVNDGAPEPTEPVAYHVADGTGPALAPGQSVAVNYSVTSWDGSSSATTWVPAYGESGEGEMTPNSGPRVQPVKGGAGSVFDLLEGFTVGSRVVIVIPASTGSPAVALVADIVGAL